MADTPKPMLDAEALFKIYNNTGNDVLVNAFHLVLAGLVLIMIIILCVMLNCVVNAPTPPKGSGVVPDYNASQIAREPLINLLANHSPALVDTATPMVNFQVATANFGGIFTTEKSGSRLLDPWIGQVSAAAATLQVEAGARAMTLDIWPNPADLSQPVVVCMMDRFGYTMQGVWTGSWGGLGAGYGRYSNWNTVTRNSLPVGEVLTAITNAAFQGKQADDPFFLIFKLHGAMSLNYLNRLGAIVQQQLGGAVMSSAYNQCNNQASIATAPVSDFRGRYCVIVVPDLQPSFPSLSDVPSVTDSKSFNQQFLATQMGQLTNLLDNNPNPIFFDPNNILAIKKTITTSTGVITTPPAAGFCLIQPTIGGPDTDNSSLFLQNYSFDNCMSTNAQFVAVNLFDQNSSDPTLTSFFYAGESTSPGTFGTYSFKYVPPSPTLTPPTPN